MTMSEFDNQQLRAPQLSLERGVGAEIQATNVAGPSWKQRCVIGITAFERPRHLERLVASLRRHLPDVRIVVADNGRQRADLPADVELLELPFDCGLSRARNALIDHTTEEMFLLLEEDFVFTEETRIDRMVEVLDNDSEIGVVGGALVCDGVKQEYAVQFHRFRETLFLEPTQGAIRVTPEGTPYQLCDMCFNFALFRRAMLVDHRWPDELKLGEHYPYYELVKSASRWRVANCDSVRAIHDLSDRSPHYQEHRRRARGFYLEHLRARGIVRVEAHPRVRFRGEELRTRDRPNIVVLGVGHSGTSILSKLLLAAGWHCADADEPFAESVAVRMLNDRYLQKGQFEADKAAAALSSPGPWLIKDPRFVFTLQRWLKVFAALPEPPLLIWIRRNSEDVVDSYVRRGELSERRATEVVDHRRQTAAEQFECWPWTKLAVDYEDLGRAAEFIRNSWRVRQT